MEKVKIIETSSSSELGKEINSFISNLNGVVIDIQYVIETLPPLTKYDLRNKTIFSALIRYNG